MVDRWPAGGKIGTFHCNRETCAKWHDAERFFMSPLAQPLCDWAFRSPNRVEGKGDRVIPGLVAAPRHVGWPAGTLSEATNHMPEVRGNGLDRARSTHFKQRLHRINILLRCEPSLGSIMGSDDNDERKAKSSFSFLSSVYDWARLTKRAMDGTDHPGLDIGISARIAAALLGLAIVVVAVAIGLLAFRPGAINAIGDSFANATLISCLSIVGLALFWTILCLLVQKHGTFAEHLMRSVAYPIILLVLALVLFAMAALIFRIIAFLGGA